jgi:hypothetical protein
MSQAPAPPPNPPTPYSTAPTSATTLSDATQMIWHKTTIRIYPVSDSQLDELTAGYNSLTLIFFGICIGAAVPLWIAFKETASTTERPYYFFGFLAASLVGMLSGIMGIRDYIRASKRKKQLYNEAIPMEVIPSTVRGPALGAASEAAE